MKKKIFIAAAVIFSSATQAQTAGKDSSKTLDEVVFTSNKFPQKQSETGKVITVITKDQLEKNSGKTLAEILNTAVGTTIIGANNNLGTNQTVSIRGASAGNVLILVDGIPVNDPSVITNYFDINLFAVNQIERVEILKGGQSTLYGSDAVAGVINIITNKAGNKTFDLHGGVAAGSYNTFKEFINFSGKKNWGNYAVSYTNLNSVGFSAAYDSAGNKNFDKDGFNQHSLNGNIDFRLSKKSRLKFLGNYNYYKASLDGAAYKDEKDYTVKNNNVQSGFGFSHNRNDGSFHFNYLFNYTERKYLDDSAYKGNPYVDYSSSKYIGRTHFAELYDNWKWSNWELLLGADYRLNNTYQYSLYVFPGYPTPASVLTAKMSQVSPYASLIYKAKNGFTVETGARVNSHSEYGSNATYSVNPFYVVKQRAKIFANLYSAFKTPTLYQLFDASYGNAKLKPEQGTIEEFGVELLPTNGFSARLVGFYRNTKNKIEFIIINPITYQSQYNNISRQENYGAELEAAYHTAKWNITANYTYTDGKTKSAYSGTGFPMAKDTTYYNLYRIPKHTTNVTAGCQATPKFYASASVHSASKRLEFIYGSKPTELKSYTTVDIYAEYKFGPGKIFADFRNITNEKYFDIPGYNSKLFNWMAGISIGL